MIIDLNSENFMKYIGYIVVIIFIIYILIKLANLQMNVVEGLEIMNTSKEQQNAGSNDKYLNDLLESIQNQTTEYKDTMLLDKYKDKYEDLILGYDELIDYEILTMIKDGIKDHNKFNEFFTLKSNLEKAMNILDSK